MKRLTFLVAAVLAALALAGEHGAGVSVASAEPSTEQIVFSRNNSAIWVVNADGTGESLIHAGGEDPDWSPDGSKIAFAMSRNLYVMNANGTGVTPLITWGSEEQSPKWSPDGSKIAFGSTLDGSFDVWVVNSDGSGLPQKLTTSGAWDYSPAWSPDGTQIAFASNRLGPFGVFMMSATLGEAGGVVLRVADAGGPALSPVDDLLAFHRNVLGNVDIWRADASSGLLQQQLTTGVLEDSQADWSHDAAEIVFASGAATSKIWKVDADGSDLTQVTFGGGSDDDPDWYVPGDLDGDGIIGGDGCPTDAEDIDGIQDEDGCPETDADGDTVLDAADGCPLSAEDIDGIQDGDGCPETDADGDTVLDEADGCPLTPEDIDGIQDGDGCPETDADGDTILDEADGCPLSAEDIDGIQDGDGCPETDADGDGVPDDVDECALSDMASSVVVGSINSGVPNVVTAGGCTIADLIAEVLALATTPGQFKSGIAHLTNALKAAGYITGAQKGAIQSAAAQSGLP